MSNGNSITRIVRLVFGVFMIAVYLGMAYLLAVNAFDWDDTALWRTVRWAMAGVFGLYGIYRCYRQITGVDYYRTRQELEEEDVDNSSYHSETIDKFTKQ